MRFLMNLIAATALAAVANGQTTINGGRQIRGVWDASGAASSKPARTGAGLPATCEVGEQYFRTDAAPGQNLNLCTAPNTWTAISGSGAGASTASQLADFTVMRVSATQLAVSVGGTVRFGNRTCPAPALPATLSITPGAAVSGTARLYARPDCTLAWALDFTDNGSLQCNGNCITEPGTGFPADSVPLYEWTAAADTWAAAGTDRRAFMSAKASKAAPSGGIVIGQDAEGADVFSLDSAAVITAGEASESPAANKLPRAGASGRIDAAWVPPMTGDAGAGGAAGLAPPPAAGDAAAGKYLKADGTWAVPAGSGDGAPIDAPYLLTAGDARLSGASNLGALSTGIPKITVSAGVATPGNAAAADVVGLFNSGSCSGYLKSDGTCGTPAASESARVYWGSGAGSLNSAGWVATANQVRCSDFYLPYPVQTSKVSVYVYTGDTGCSGTDHCYSVGIVDLATGTTLVSTAQFDNASSGFKTLNWQQGATTLATGWKAFCFTGSTATLAIGAGNYSVTFGWHGFYDAGTTPSANGVFPASVVMPSQSFSNRNVPWFVLHQ